MFGMTSRCPKLPTKISGPVVNVRESFASGERHKHLQVVRVEVVVLQGAKVHPAERAFYGVTVSDAKVSRLQKSKKGGRAGGRAGGRWSVGGCGTSVGRSIGPVGASLRLLHQVKRPVDL